MKKNLIIAGIAALAFGATAQTAQGVEVNNNQVTVAAKVLDEKKPVKQIRAVLPDMAGGLRFDYYDRGTSPKEYGQMLQRTGRQKWNKKR